MVVCLWVRIENPRYRGYRFFKILFLNHQQSNLLPMFFHYQLKMLVQNDRNLE